MNSDTRNQWPSSRHKGIKSLSYALDIVTKPVFLKRGFAENRIITDWVKIVGEAVAAQSVPRKLTFGRDKKIDGTLHIEVNNSGLATEMVYLEPVILEKIACYFGYKAVARLKIMQNLKAAGIPEKPAVKKSASSNVLEKLEELLVGIEDEELKKSLRSLGSGVLAE